jgi:type II secretory pathway pseudopilin PulG
MPAREFHRPTDSSGGFSLIEVVLAIGIVSFALVAILGLLPVALDSARNSQRETHAALIARTIFTDLNSRMNPKRFLIVSGGSVSLPTTEIVDLTRDENHFLSYDSDGLVLGTITPAAFESGTPDAGYVVHIETRQLDPGSTSATSRKGMSQISVSVEAPGAAFRSKRAVYPFATLVQQGTPSPP